MSPNDNARSASRVSGEIASNEVLKASREVSRIDDSRDNSIASSGVANASHAARESLAKSNANTSASEAAHDGARSTAKATRAGLPTGSGMRFQEWKATGASNAVGRAASRINSSGDNRLVGGETSSGVAYSAANKTGNEVPGKAASEPGARIDNSKVGRGNRARISKVGNSHPGSKSANRRCKWVANNVASEDSGDDGNRAIAANPRG